MKTPPNNLSILHAVIEMLNWPVFSKRYPEQCLGLLWTELKVRALAPKYVPYVSLDI